jgi:mannose-6-phosphate isomerase-like protein (cupin superfamily)
MARELPITDNGSIRPWGSYQILYDGDDCKVKRITVKPGKKLSLQFHYKRDELWQIISGKGILTLEDTQYVLEAQDSRTISRKQHHRIENIGKEDLVFIEIQTGDYFGEDDIVRIEDDYGRV